MNFRKTKIIATLGPASGNYETIKGMIKSGLNVIRINFSHARYEEIDKWIENIRKISKELKTPVSILADLKGPEIRTDKNQYQLKVGMKIAFVKGKGDIAKNEIGITHSTLHKLVKKGGEIVADDGFFAFKVLEIKDEKIICKVLNSGLLKSTKSINVPSVDIKLPIIGAKDKIDLEYICEQDFDWIAASFVTSSKDIKKIREFTQKRKKDIPVIAKIESHQAISNIDEIIEESEGIMVARGDLGVELPLERVPYMQNVLIRKTKQKGKVIIVATQMLDSMTDNSNPTRAEVTDIYYSAQKRVDAVMLSSETASGKYPVESVTTMSNIITECENNLDEYNRHAEIQSIDFKSKEAGIEDIRNICRASLKLALDDKAKFLIVVSIYGKSPKIISSFRADTSVISVYLNEKFLHRSVLYYGSIPLYFKNLDVKKESSENQLIKILTLLQKEKMVKKKDNIIYLFSYPLNTGSANSIRKVTV